MRGTRTGIRLKTHLRRITPACAGNTYAIRNDVVQKKDHPRMCGEYYDQKWLAQPSRGSPPHVRGILNYTSKKVKAFRITPACAGNTSKARKKPCKRLDHPRMCGEYGLIRTQAPASSGSPPHVRGILFPLFKRAFAYRITPACAGNTLNRALKIGVFEL